MTGFGIPAYIAKVGNKSETTKLKRRFVSLVVVFTCEFQENVVSLQLYFITTHPKTA